MPEQSMLLLRVWTKAREEQSQVQSPDSSLWHLHLPIIEQHPIHGLNGPSRCLMCLKVDKAIATRSIFITNHLQTQREGQRKETGTVFLNIRTQVHHRKTHPHLPGAFSLPDILLPLQLSSFGVLAAGQGDGQSQDQIHGALYDIQELMAPQDPHATGALSWDRMTQHSCAGTGAKAPILRGNIARPFGFKAGGMGI